MPLFWLGVCWTVALHNVVQDQELSDAPSLWCSTLTVCYLDLAHRYNYAPSRSIISQCQCSRTFIPFSVSLWNNLGDTDIRWCGTGGFQEQGEESLFNGLPAHSIFVSEWFPFLFFHTMGWYCIADVFKFWTDRVLIALSGPCITNLF